MSGRTSASTIETVTGITRRCGKRPPVVDDVPTAWGCVADGAFFAADCEVVADGVCTRSQVDDLLRDAFAWPAGLFTVPDGASRGSGEDRQGLLASVFGVQQQDRE